jgi:hypothetical protein
MAVAATFIEPDHLDEPLELASIYAEDSTPVASDDAKAAELGTRFKVGVPGLVTGVRFHKSLRNTGGHTASLWSSAGQRLARAKARGETRSGWQTVTFPRPIPVSEAESYVASYHTNSGHYSIREGAYAGGSIGTGTVRGLAGVYRYGRSAFPHKTWRNSDYYVEPIFTPDSTTSTTAAGSPSPTVATSAVPEVALPTAPTSSTEDAPSSAGPTSGGSEEPTPASTPAPTVSESASTSPTTAGGSTDAPTGWPNAQNTGAKGTLEPISGRTITADGTTLENVMVNGQLTIKADNVTLRNVHVKTDSYYGVLTYGRNLLIEDSTLEGKVGTTAGLAAYEQGSFVARRLNVFNSEDGVRLADNSKLFDSYIHDLVGTSGAHYDSVTADMYTGWEIVHNTILNQHSWTAAVWVGDPRYDPSSGLLKNNFLAGGGYVIYGGPGTSPGIHVVDNVFSTRYFPRGGYWGPVTYWEPAGNTWSGNTWADGPNAGKPVSP